MTFNIGDVVQLKSGGPLMTVTESYGQGSVLCKWFNNNIPQEAEFPPAALLPYVEPSTTPADAVNLWE